MASSDEQRQWKHSTTYHRSRRPIPGRMSNYHEPAPQPRNPDVMSDYRRRGPVRRIPGRMANYLEEDHSDAISSQTSLINRGRVITKSRMSSQNPAVGESLDFSESSSPNESPALSQDPTPSEDQASSDLTEDQSVDQGLPESRSSSIHSRASLEEGGTELQTFQPKFGDTNIVVGRQLAISSLTDSGEKGVLTLKSLRLRMIAWLYDVAGRKFQDRIRRSRYHGWRMGILLGIFASAFVLLCNIALVAIGHLRSGYDKDGIATLYAGDEAAVSWWNTFAHIMINALSTVLLSMSNYTMQVLNSPTREELNKAHRRGKWLDIGLLSIHNLRIISRKRAFLCFMLACSSIPLHLFYNASIFKIIKKYRYYVTVMDTRSNVFRERERETQMVSLSIADWRGIYADTSVSKYGNLLLGVDSLVWNTSSMPNKGNFLVDDFFPRNISGNEFPWLTKVSDEGWAPLWWSISVEPNVTLPSMMHVNAGLATNFGRESRIQVNIYFMIVVLFFNLFKLVIMTGALFVDRSDPLVTLGDAAASFLEHPEPLTNGKCTLETQELFASYGVPAKTNASRDPEADDIDSYPSGEWKPRLRKYCSSVGFDKAWSATISVFCLVLVIVIFPTRANDLNAMIWKWGTASGGSLSIGSKEASTTGTTWNAWLSNMPQVLLSMCYVNLNTICTSMASSKEWNTYASSRKGLRVTKATGEQRSTYFLQLPYKWAFPLMIISGFLHWLLSQTFFLTRIDYHDENGKLDTWKSACGVSFSSLITFCFVALSLVCGLLLIARWPMFPRLPLAENCSLMISAACHPALDEVEPQLAKVKWGVVPDLLVDGYKHCSLSSKEVEKPEVGKIYL